MLECIFSPSVTPGNPYVPFFTGLVRKFFNGSASSPLAVFGLRITVFFFPSFTSSRTTASSVSWSMSAKYGFGRFDCGPPFGRHAGASSSSAGSSGGGGATASSPFLPFPPLPAGAVRGRPRRRCPRRILLSST